MSPARPSGYEWWVTNWHYFPIYESLKEALRADGKPFVEVTDADIESGDLLHSDGSPRYPIVISLASEAIGDGEIAPLRDYVSAGGFLFVGSSAMTRHTDGSTRGDFALANEMGIHMVTGSLLNWALSGTFSKAVTTSLVTGIPSGTLTWHMALGSEEIPWGVSPSHTIDWEYYVWPVKVTDATLIARGSSAPVLTTKKYGQGTFIYHGALEPLIGNGGAQPGMFSYLIYRNAIEWAFEAANLPIVRLSPWRYQYNAAFMVRHDFENFADMIRAIESSAAFERSAGARGEYYFCTGTLRDQMSDKTTVIASLKRAITNSGATIGSHNGGLKNPVNLSLAPSDYRSWHWGPDEALDTRPAGYSSGQAYTPDVDLQLVSGPCHLVVRRGQRPDGMRSAQRLPAHVGSAVLQRDARGFVCDARAVGRHHARRTEDRSVPALDGFDANTRKTVCPPLVARQRMVQRHHHTAVDG